MKAVYPHSLPDRYQRQTILPQIGAAGQERLKSAKVLVVGVGGLGTTASMFLAGAGIGTLGLIDSGFVELTNLHRQPMFTEADVGKEKVLCAEERLRAENSEVTIEVYPEKLTATNADKTVGKYDLIVDASDNFATKYLINDVCVLSDKPFISASLYRFSGQIALFNGIENGSRGPSYRCLFPDEHGVEDDCEISGILGPVAGIVGGMEALEAIKYLSGMPQAAGKVLMANFLTNEFSVFSFPRSKTAVDEAKIAHDQRKTSERASAEFTIVNAQLAAFLESNESMCFIDLRDAKTQSELEGLKIPVSVIPKKLEEIRRAASDASLVVVYCENGFKSARAVRFLRDKISARVVHLSDGLYGWRRYVHSE